MFTKSQKKEWIKNGIYIFFILLLAVISTHYIYYHFQDDRNIDFNSESLDVTYRESTGNKIALTKITPVTDSVGLSSKAYVITIKNNLTEKVNYKIILEDDPEYIELEETAFLFNELKSVSPSASFHVMSSTIKPSSSRCFKK